MAENWLTESLEELRAAIWRELERGAREAKSPLHTPVFATVTTDGAPAARVVVLREGAPDTRRLRCHTDARSLKTSELERNRATAWLFYDAAQKIQIRATGPARVHQGDGLAREAWEQSRLDSRRCYLATQAPGALSDAPASGLPPEFVEQRPTAEESEAGWPNFAVIVAEIMRLDWLYLAARGHRRAQFVWDGAAWQGRWVIP
jgi:3-hydroxyisobutyrate dehydrogenase